VGRQEIYINNKQVDLIEGVSMPLNFNIADVRDPANRNASYSKTISIPATKANNLLFTNIFEVNKEVYTTDATVNFSPDFNPNLKASCLIYIDSILQLKGTAQLLNIVRDGDAMMYEVAVVGEANNLFKDIGANKLTDLDFSRFNHAYTKANIINSWDTSIKINNATIPFAYGSGYVYPMIDLGYTDGTYYDLTNWLPSIYLKTYIDEIFADAGYTYTSTFMTSDLFKHLVIPYNRTKIELDTTGRDTYLFKATLSTSLTGTLASTASEIEVDYDTENWDIGGNYNNVTYKYTAPADGSFIFDFTGDYTRYGASNIVFKIYKNGSFLSSETFTMSASTGSFAVGIYGVDLVAGDYVRFKVAATGLSALTTLRYTIDNFTVANRLTSVTTLEGATVNMNLCIPKDIQQKDLLLSVIKMFNLYVDIDKNNSKNLIIQTRDDFYANNTYVDWTDKIDYGQQIEIKPLSELNFKEYKFTYKADKDYFNELYTKEIGEVYGQYSNEVVNDFQTDTNLVEVIFSPTPSVGNSSFDRVVPKIVKRDDNNVDTPIDFNIRILYYAGLLNCDVWEFRSTNSGNEIYSVYPYVGHFDDPYAPEIIDLNFGYLQECFWNLNSSINKNLFNYLHSKHIQEITSKDSKMITAYFHLLPMDIYNLNFRNYVFLKDAYFIINKIIDYDFLNNSLTKVELLKIKNAPDYSYSELPAPPQWDNDSGSWIVEGGLNEVRSISATSDWTIVEGGEDEVRDISATSYITLLEGGQN